MNKLNYYTDKQGKEYIAIVTNPEFEKQCKEDGLKLEDSTTLTKIGGFTSWPTDRLMSEE